VGHFLMLWAEVSPDNVRIPRPAGESSTLRDPLLNDIQ